MVRTRIRMQFTVFTLAACVLAPAPAAPQAPAAAEREAFAALGRAVEAVERAPDGNALRRAAGQAVAAAEQAANAFAETDRARDAALGRVPRRLSRSAGRSGHLHQRLPVHERPGRSVRRFRRRVRRPFRAHRRGVGRQRRPCRRGRHSRRRRGPRPGGSHPGSGRPHARSGSGRRPPQVECAGREHRRRDRRGQRAPHACERGALRRGPGPCRCGHTGDGRPLPGREPHPAAQPRRRRAARRARQRVGRHRVATVPYPGGGNLGARRRPHPPGRYRRNRRRRPAASRCRDRRRRGRRA